MTTSHLKDDIITEEGYGDQLVDGGCAAYPDPLTKGPPWTIGFGSTGPDITQGTVWTRAQAESRLDSDILNITEWCKAHYPWWGTLSDLRQDVLVSMAYQLGTHGLDLFVGTLAAIARGDFVAAANHMLASKWATQTVKRADRLALQMRTNTSAYGHGAPAPQPQPQPTETVPMSDLSRLVHFVFDPVLASIARAGTSSNPTAQATAVAASAAVGKVVTDVNAALSGNSAAGMASPIIKDLEDGLQSVVNAFVASAVTSSVPVVGGLLAPEAVNLADAALTFAEQHALTYVSALFHFHKENSVAPTA